MDLWLRRRFIYIDEYVNTRLEPNRIKNFYNKENPIYRHTNCYYTHLMFFVIPWARNELSYITGEQEMSILIYIKKKYEEKIIELIKQYGH